ncbi:MAG: preprotein translocase subunit SecY [Myxococcales bacterium]|nr:preprotein translocase subunit SecY [Myxococcales bacterium]
MTRWISTIWRMPDLRSRVLFTLGMLAVYRLGAHIPAPGVNREALAKMIEKNSQSMFGLYDMFTGGALGNFSVFVLGIMPYITASIIVQILTVAIPTLERISKEGQQGRGRITQYTRYATIGIALVQGVLMVALPLESQQPVEGMSIVLDPGWNFRILTAITLTAGSCFVMWIGEQISERGVGNGSSLIITAGILSRLPGAVQNSILKLRNDETTLLQLTLLGFGMVIVIGLIVWIEKAQRRIPIQYAKRIVGRKVYNGAQSSHLPLKINTAGVIPPIFASSVLMAPATILTFTQGTEGAAADFVSALTAALQPGAWLYNYAEVGLIVFFAYFYTAMVFNPVDVADNLKKHGGYIPGIRPGRQTAEYIDHILTRLTGVGALYMAGICVLPIILSSQYGTPFAFGGTGLLIVVNVSLDTVAQIEAQLLTQHYDGISGPQAPGMSGGRRRLLAGADPV